jgi:hypothetical protein
MMGKTWWRLDNTGFHLKWWKLQIVEQLQLSAHSIRSQFIEHKDFFFFFLLFKKIFSYKAKRLLTRASKRTHRKTSDISIESYPAKVNTNFDSCKRERKEQTQQNQMNCLDTDAFEMLQKEPSLLIPCLNK